MGLSVHDPFVDPLGNPLGLKLAGAEPGRFLGPCLIIVTAEGPGSFVIPKGTTGYRIIAVGAGAAGTTSYSGGSGAVAIRHGTVDKNNIKISWSVGKGGDGISPGGEQTVVTGPDFQLIAGGGVAAGALLDTAIATGGTYNYNGQRRLSTSEIREDSSTGPASGSGYGTSNINGGGSGYAGGQGGAGQSAAYTGGHSLVALGSAPIGLNVLATSTSSTIFSGQPYSSATNKSGDGGIGGGGGGRGTNPGNGGVGTVRIELW